MSRFILMEIIFTSNIMCVNGWFSTYTSLRSWNNWIDDLINLFDAWACLKNHRTTVCHLIRLNLRRTADTRNCGKSESRINLFWQNFTKVHDSCVLCCLLSFYAKRDAKTWTQKDSPTLIKSPERTEEKVWTLQRNSRSFNIMFIH